MRIGVALICHVRCETDVVYRNRGAEPEGGENLDKKEGDLGGELMYCLPDSRSNGTWVIGRSGTCGGSIGAPIEENIQAVAAAKWKEMDGESAQKLG